MKNLFKFTNTNSETTFPHESKLSILVGLICIDLAILALHFYNSWIPDEQWNSFFALAVDFSIGEFFQYFKWFSIAALFVFIAVKRASLTYLSWALVFTYLLLDDSLALHENLGKFLMQNASFAPPLGLRLQDIGELLVSAIAGSILLFLLVLAYMKSDDFFKTTTHNMLLLILALVFFGVLIDMVAVMTYTGKISAFIFDVIEDGGEMFVASFMLWYVVLVSKAQELAITFKDSLRSIKK